MTQPPHAPLDPAAALLEASVGAFGSALEWWARARFTPPPPLSRTTSAQVSEATVARITDAFSQLGAKADFDDAVGGLLAQLLDKSMLYAPLKAICEHVRQAGRQRGGTAARARARWRWWLEQACH